MSTKRNIAIGVIGIGAFVVASIAATILSTAVTALIPGKSPDAPGQLDPSAEDKIKAANKSAEIAKESTADSSKSQDETPTETVKQSEVATSPGEPISEPPPIRYQAPAPAPRPQTGPGNLNEEYYERPSFSGGPGNM